jgi:type IX secretion system PorP/SprF family membrane protein
MKPVFNKDVKSINSFCSMLFTVTIVIFVLVLSTKWSNAQDAIFSQHYANPLYLNPAFTGTTSCNRLIFNYRNQPFPLFGSFSTYSFSADYHSDLLSGGIGINLVHDTQGGLADQSQAGAFYAWQSRLTPTWNISFGIQVSYINTRHNRSNLIFPDQNLQGSNTISNTGETFNQPAGSHNADFSSGILIYNDKFYAGLAINHLTQPKIELFENSLLERKYSLMMGYNFTTDERPQGNPGNVSVSPNVIVQSQSSFIRFNYGLSASLKSLVGGVWFRHSIQHPNTLIFMLGIKQVNYTIGYSYDYSLSGFSTAGGGAHEIGVLLNFACREPDSRYRILNCPTF